MGRKAMCATHHETEAATRCRRCSRPLCSACVFDAPGGPFCGESCAALAARFPRRGVLSRAGSRLVRLVKFTFWAVILLVIAVVVGAKLFNNPFCEKLIAIALSLRR